MTDAQPLHVSQLIEKLQVAQFEHGDRPVYLVTHQEVIGAVATGYDTYSRAEGTVIEIIGEGGE